MTAAKDLIKNFEAAHGKGFGAKFFKADLHFHTPASADARGSNRYNFNPFKIKYPAGQDTRKYRRNVKEIQNKVLADARKLAAKMVQRFLEVNLSLVAVTDHNGIGTIWADAESEKGQMDLAAPTWYELIDDEAVRVNKETSKRLIILPGVEISTTGIHILAIFPPQRPRRKVHFMICDLLNELGFEIDAWGIVSEVGTASVFDVINLIVKKGGIPVPAHIDARDKAVLNLFKINSGDMKKVLLNKHLSAVEIVDPARFTRKDRKLKKPLKAWIDTLRRKEELPLLAYFQGSDAHDLPTVAKRHTFIKMTEPSFSGLKTAIQMPSSRVRISELHQPEVSGLYIHSLEIKNKFFGQKVLRFNRHLNCIAGRKGSGKSLIFHLMQAGVNPNIQAQKGEIKLFMEKLINASSSYYAFTRETQEKTVRLFSIDQENRSADVIDLQQAADRKIKPKFYDAARIEKYISSVKKLNQFLIKRVGEPTRANVRSFNKMFSIPAFLEARAEPLLSLKVVNGTYQLALNVNWRRDKAKMKNFFKLGFSLRRTMIMCMVIIMSDFGPTIIDAPERNFDNEDIINYLVPIIKAYKDSQQVILFTNNPILAVNTDPDNYILLEMRGAKFKSVSSGFAIDDKRQKEQLLNIMEGSLRSFRRRAKRYE